MIQGPRGCAVEFITALLDPSPDFLVTSTMKPCGSEMMFKPRSIKVCTSRWDRGDKIFQSTGQLLLSVNLLTSLHPIPEQVTKPPGDQGLPPRLTGTQLHVLPGESKRGLRW